MLEKILFGVTTALAEGASAVADTGTAPVEEQNVWASMLSMVIPMALMIAVFYFMLIRPQRKKDKEVKDMLANLKRGDLVTTIGGIYGTIESIKDETITLSIGQKNQQPTEMTVARWAIRQVENVSVENDSELPS